MPVLGRRVERLRPELVEHRQHLEQRRSLAPEVGLRHLDAVPLRDDRVLPGGGERRQVVAADQPRQHLATGVTPLGRGGTRSTASATNPCAPLVAGRLGLRGHVGAGGRGRPRPAARARRRRPGWRTARPHAARGRRAATGRPRWSSSRGTGPAPARWSRRPGRAAGARRGRSRSPARARSPAAASRGRAAGAARRRPHRARPRPAGPTRGRGRDPSPRTPRASRPAGAGPCPQSTRGVGSFAVATIAGRSPPGPFRCGSTTCSTKPPADGGVEGVAAELEHPLGRLRGQPVGRGHHPEGAREGRSWS